MYTPIQISNYFIKKSFETDSSNKKPLTLMKLLKLAYIAHGWNLGIFKEPLLSELAQAWKYGPVVPSIYHEFKRFGSNQISQMAVAANGEIPEIDYSDAQSVALLNKIWEVYSKYDGLQLSTLTHQPGTPWETIWNACHGKDTVGAVIPNELIQDYYTKIIERNNAKGGESAAN